MRNNGTKKLIYTLLPIIAITIAVIYFKDLIYIAKVLIKSLSPAIMGTLLAGLLNVPMKAFESVLERLFKRKNKATRLISLLFAFCLLGLLMAFLVRGLLPQIITSLTELINALPEFIEGVFDFIERVLGKGVIEGEIRSQCVSVVITAINGLIASVVKMTPDIIGFSVETFKLFSDAFFAVAVAGFVLCDKEGILATLNELFVKTLPKKAATTCSTLLAELIESFNGYYGGQMIEAVILGILCFIGMLVLKLPYAPLVSVIICVTAIIPILGAIIGGTASTVLIMIYSPSLAVVFLVFLIVLQLLEGNLIYPKVVGKKVELPPLYVLIALLIGNTFGIYGTLTSVPIAALVYQHLFQAPIAPK